MSSELRTKFLNYMTIQRFSNRTKDLHVRGVQGLAKYYGQSPDTLTNEQIQAYFIHLIDERKLAWGTCNNYFSAIICFSDMSAIGTKHASRYPHDHRARNCLSF